MHKPRHVLSAIAVFGTALVGGVAIQQSVSADVSSGDRPVLIQITPCRLADTRPAPLNTGSRLGKLGPAETETFDVLATDTDCAGLIPSDAVGLSTNMTALGATSQSFYTVWPSGPRPDASSLNPAPGEPPTPNAVATPIDAGKFNVYNNRGENHIVIDINGYYINHNHDDLYGGPQPSPTAGTFSVGTAAFDAWSTNIGWQKSLENGTGNGGAWVTSMPYTGGSVPTVGLAAPVHLPDGATITSVTGYFSDDAPTASLAFQLRCEELDGGVKIVANGGSTAAPATGEAAMSITSSNAVVDNSACSYFFIAESGSWDSVTDQMKIRGVSITTV
ncbi:MAG: hypothetical protein AB8G14_08760 [Ilumatobacter sp.]